MKGHTYTSIASKLGCTKQNVSGVIRGEIHSERVWEEVERILGFKARDGIVDDNHISLTQTSDGNETSCSSSLVSYQMELETALGTIQDNVVEMGRIQEGLDESEQKRYSSFVKGFVVYALDLAFCHRKQLALDCIQDSLREHGEIS